LGIVQGATEFLPISSTAHVRIVPELFGWQDPGAAFTAVIQLGTLLAVLAYFRADIAQITSRWLGSMFAGKDDRSKEARLGWAVLLGTIPIIVAGLLLTNWIENDLRSLYVIAIALITVGILMAVAEVLAKHVRTLGSIAPMDGLLLGVWQALALIPGVSRSGITITGALFSGFEREAAARFSFLLSIPAVSVAGIYELVKQRDALSAMGFVPLLIATSAAFVVGYASIDFLLKFLRTRTTAAFVVYRVALGALLLFLLAVGKLHP
jgi:undecaprenyl-diphosphatase